MTKVREILAGAREEARDVETARHVAEIISVGLLMESAGKTIWPRPGAFPGDLAGSMIGQVIEELARIDRAKLTSRERGGLGWDMRILAGVFDAGGGAPSRKPPPTRGIHRTVNGDWYVAVNEPAGGGINGVYIPEDVLRVI